MKVICMCRRCVLCSTGTEYSEVYELSLVFLSPHIYLLLFICCASSTISRQVAGAARDTLHHALQVHNTCMHFLLFSPRFCFCNSCSLQCMHASRMLPSHSSLSLPSTPSFSSPVLSTLHNSYQCHHSPFLHFVHLKHCQVCTRELASAIDNPVVLRDGRVESNGNVHGAPVGWVQYQGWIWKNRGGCGFF